MAGDGDAQRQRGGEAASSPPILPRRAGRQDAASRHGNAAICGPTTALDCRRMRIGIVGLGYVGLPLAVAFAEAGHDVVGYRRRRGPRRAARRGRERHRGRRPRSGCGRSGSASPRRPTPTALPACDAILICVPTPLAAQREPDLTYVRASAETIAGTLREGQLVVLESTTYPGTTREEILPLLERGGLRVGEGFHLAYSPERIDPGRSDQQVAETPKVVGGDHRRPAPSGPPRSTPRSATRSSPSPRPRRPSSRSCSRTSSARSTSPSSTSSPSSPTASGSTSGR